MRRLLLVLLMLSLTACTAMLLGGAESGEGQKDCDEYPDQTHCK